MDAVAHIPEPLIVAKRGKPLVKLVAIEDETPASLYGCMKGTVTFHGDILAPVEEAWSAESGDEDDLYKGLLHPPGRGTRK